MAIVVHHELRHKGKRQKRLYSLRKKFCGRIVIENSDLCPFQNPFQRLRDSDKKAVDFFFLFSISYYFQNSLLICYNVKC